MLLFTLYNNLFYYLLYILFWVIRWWSCHEVIEVSIVLIVEVLIDIRFFFKYHHQSGKKKTNKMRGKATAEGECVLEKDTHPPQKKLWLMWRDEIVAEGQQSGTEHCRPDGPIRWPVSTRSWGPRPWWKQPVSTDRCLSRGPVQRTVRKRWQSLKPCLLMFFPVLLLPGLAGLWPLFESWPRGGLKRKVKLNGSAERWRGGRGVQLFAGAGGVHVSITHLDCTTSLSIQQGKRQTELAHSVMPDCGHHEVSCSALVHSKNS